MTKPTWSSATVADIFPVSLAMIRLQGRPPSTPCKIMRLSYCSIFLIGVDCLRWAALTVGSGLAIHDLDQGTDQRDGAIIGRGRMGIRHQAKAQGQTDHG